ncbi:MAG: tyrosine-protein phosphatase [Gemmatimonadaceae bacterium]
MIDLHTHLLPGVDDGSPSVDASLPVLERFASDGVELLVCTPHLRASDAARAPHREHSAILATLVARAPARPRLELGWEIMLDVPGADLRAPELALAGSSAVLVEFPRAGLPVGAAQELYRLRMSGIVPLVAHPERYSGCTVTAVTEWRRIGAAIQMDAAGLLGHPPMALLARSFLEAGLVDCIASDNHGDARSLASARDWLTELGAIEQARLLTQVNAARLLANEAPLPVAPVRIRRGALGRLKEMLLGRR